MKSTSQLQKQAEKAQSNCQAVRGKLDSARAAVKAAETKRVPLLLPASLDDEAAQKSLQVVNRERDAAAGQVADLELALEQAEGISKVAEQELAAASDRKSCDEILALGDERVKLLEDIRRHGEAVAVMLPQLEKCGQKQQELFGQLRPGGAEFAATGSGNPIWYPGTDAKLAALAFMLGVDSRAFVEGLIQPAQVSSDWVPAAVRNGLERQFGRVSDAE